MAAATAQHAADDTVVSRLSGIATVAVTAAAVGAGVAAATAAAPVVASGVVVGSAAALAAGAAGRSSGEAPATGQAIDRNACSKLIGYLHDLSRQHSREPAATPVRVGASQRAALQQMGVAVPSTVGEIASTISILDFMWQESSP